MQTSRPLWFLLNLYGWAVIGMSVVTAVILDVDIGWRIAVVALGVIGYLAALLVDLVSGSNLGRTGVVRLARAEQENRELRSEQARLLGAIKEREAKLATAKTANSQQ